MLKDDTGIAKYLLLDAIANMIVNENATKILNGCLDEGSEMIEDEESSVLKTPSSKHMQEERDEVPDLTSTSKKLCSKAVKMEKLDEEEIKNKKNN
ncbi:hypothetical protein Bca101_057532 [Brassica carinata]